MPGIEVGCADDEERIRAVPGAAPGSERGVRFAREQLCHRRRHQRVGVGVALLLGDDTEAMFAIPQGRVGQLDPNRFQRRWPVAAAEADGIPRRAAAMPSDVKKKLKKWA